MPIRKFLDDNHIHYSENEPLKKVTGMNIIGNISIIARPNSVCQLKSLYNYVLKTHSTYEIFGSLSNTYLCSNFDRDIVIRTTNVKDIVRGKDEVIIGCGYNLTKLSKELSEEGVTGFEGLVGIPGTVGAAAINNSGAFCSVMSSLVKGVTILTKEGVEQYLSNSDIVYTTRSSILKKNKFGVLLSVTLDVSHHDDPQKIRKKIEQYTRLRSRYIDGNRKSLGSIVAGHTIHNIWRENKMANFVRQVMYAPFKNTSLRKKMQCMSEFIALGGYRFIKHCDNIGRFCWTNSTKEEDFFDYLDFLKRKSKNTIELEIEIKK